MVDTRNTSISPRGDPHLLSAAGSIDQYTQKKRVPKQCPLGAIARTVPLDEPNYGQPNSATQGTVLARFFSECSLKVNLCVVVCCTHTMPSDEAFLSEILR